MLGLHALESAERPDRRNAARASILGSSDSLNKSPPSARLTSSSDAKPTSVLPASYVEVDVRQRFDLLVGFQLGDEFQEQP